MKVVVNPEYSFLEPFIRSVPDIFSGQGETIYKGRNELKVFDVNGLSINIKSFKVPHLINRIAYRWFRPSKARRSYVYGLRSIECGVATPTPIAYIEMFTGGLLTHSYYLSVHEEGWHTMKYIYSVPDEEVQTLLEAYTRYTALAHEQGVYHKDYSPGNILFKEENGNFRFTIVDLNRMEFGPVDLEKGCQAFRRTSLHPEQMDMIATLYARERGMDEEKSKVWVRQYNDLFWKEYLKRHPEWKRIYIRETC